MAIFSFDEAADRRVKQNEFVSCTALFSRWFRGYFPASASSYGRNKPLWEQSDSCDPPPKYRSPPPAEKKEVTAVVEEEMSTDELPSPTSVVTAGHDLRQTTNRVQQLPDSYYNMGPPKRKRALSGGGGSPRGANRVDEYFAIHEMSYYGLMFDHR